MEWLHVVSKPGFYVPMRLAGKKLMLTDRRIDSFSTSFRRLLRRRILFVFESCLITNHVVRLWLLLLKITWIGGLILVNPLQNGFYTTVNRVRLEEPSNKRICFQNTFSLSTLLVPPRSCSNGNFSRRNAGFHQTTTTTTSTTTLHVLTMPTEYIIEQQITKIPSFVLDDLIDESVRTQARRPIIMQFNAQAVAGRNDWIWRKWTGTVFSETWDSCIYKMIYASILYIVLCFLSATFSSQTTTTSTLLHASSSTSSSTSDFKSFLSGFDMMYGQILLPITTFTLTFFVDQAYTIWGRCLGLSRELQGRLHDISLICAANAARKNPTSGASDAATLTQPSPGPSSSSTTTTASTPKATTNDELLSSAASTSYSTYTDGSRQLLRLISRYVRLFNLLTYASLTRSHRPILTPRGMRRLVERGLMTEREREILVTAEIPATQRHTAVLSWIFRIFVEGKASGHFTPPSSSSSSTGYDCSSLEQQFIELLLFCRGSCGAIGSTLHSRMRLAYAHIVQILIDIVIWMFPIMAFTSGMSGFVCVLGTGLLTLGYQGLFDLAKRFLDPFDNENFGKCEDPFVVDTLIAETNAGSVRWINGLEKFPIPNHLIQHGNLSSFILPLCGYTAEESDKMMGGSNVDSHSDN